MGAQTLRTDNPSHQPSASAVRALRAEYTPAKWEGKDTSGILCVGAHILVLMDECAPVTAGGVHLTAEGIERQTEGSETGVVVQMGGVAFRIGEDGQPWAGVIPDVGDRVFVERYAGQKVRGVDGNIYRSMHYGNVHAVFATNGMGEPTKVTVTRGGKKQTE